MRSALAFLLLFLASCGAARSLGLADEPVRRCETYDVAVAPLPDGVAGQTDWGDCSVRISASILGDTEYDRAHVVNVLVHELWHAAGHEPHFDRWTESPTMGFYATSNIPPSDVELAWMSGVQGQVFLRVVSAELAEATDEAAGLWNWAIQSNVFVVVEGP